jgi:hypothetical protein
LSLAWLLPFLGACSAAESSTPLFTVAELEPRIDELNGQTVRVVGYLRECRGYDCTLYSQKSDADARADAVARALAEERQNKQPTSLPEFPEVGIGSGEAFEFDAEAAAFTASYVVITGNVANECRHEGKRGCTDRSPDLHPTGITAWKGPVPPPPQSPNGRAT